ncbi:hypothetical protein [Pseudoalteromonas viridis]|uniref:Uncharacterized protein n=1 Tax=Pseudoalteromonas viridis TaxID=339617 RepID=A0ABX7V0R0_9GAMM|nr:hypothetical protein [Pseudoalteromonas viridis]QTL34451.1 hypothetical protein J5X90_12940 [Pseudoalteromonas viridis]
MITMVQDQVGKASVLWLGFVLSCDTVSGHPSTVRVLSAVRPLRWHPIIKKKNNSIISAYYVLALFL